MTEPFLFSEEFKKMSYWFESPEQLPNQMKSELFKFCVSFMAV